MSLRLEDDHMCYACGSENKLGLRLKFQRPEKGRLLSEVVFSKEHQGFKDIVHGGMMGLVLDEIMLNLVWIEGGLAVTGELALRLKKPARVGERVLLEGRVDKDDGRIVYTSATAKTPGGELLATAKASCVKIKAPLAEGSK